MVFTRQQIELIYPNALGHTVEDIKLLLSMIDDVAGPFRFYTEWEMDIHIRLSQPMLVQDENCIHALQKIIRDGTPINFYKTVWESPLREIPTYMGHVRGENTPDRYLRVACRWRLRIGH